MRVLNVFIETESLPEFEEPHEDESVEAMAAEDVVLRDTESSWDPSDGRKEAREGEGRVERKLSAVAIGEEASVVDDGVAWLLLKHGEEPECEDGESYVDRRRRYQALWRHLSSFLCSSLSLLCENRVALRGLSACNVMPPRRFCLDFY